MSARDGIPPSGSARSAKGTERSSPGGAGEATTGVVDESAPGADERASTADEGAPSADETEVVARAEGSGAVGSSSAEADREAEGWEPAEAVARQRDEYLDALRRLQADFENYKKRILKQQTAHLERAAETLVEKLLPVLDTLDLALAHADTSEDPEGEALVQVRSMLSDVLAREGLERIDPLNERFDPTVHDAVMHEEGDEADPAVSEVFRAGYRWKGRVIRPAMVKVTG